MKYQSISSPGTTRLLSARASVGPILARRPASWLRGGGGGPELPPLLSAGRGHVAGPTGTGPCCSGRAVCVAARGLRGVHVAAAAEGSSAVGWTACLMLCNSCSSWSSLLGRRSVSERDALERGGPSAYLRLVTLL